MSDSLIPKFLQKLSDLDKFVGKEKNDKNSIQVQIRKLQQWLVDDRSLLEHRCCQSFLTYLWQSHGKDYKDRRGFVSGMKCKLKFADIVITKTTIDGVRVEFQKFLPWSLSFGSCSQKLHHKFFNDLQEFAERVYKIDFNKWKKEWESNEHLLQ